MQFEDKYKPYPINPYPKMSYQNIQEEVPLYFPSLSGYDDSGDLDKDCEYMKQLYPKQVQIIQKEVDEECDKLEYDGSCMFDAYPDKICLNRIIEVIYNKIETPTSSEEVLDTPPLLTNQIYPFLLPAGRPCPNCRPNRPLNQSLNDMIGILLFQEMLQRRRRYRSRRRWF